MCVWRMMGVGFGEGRQFWVVFLVGWECGGYCIIVGTGIVVRLRLVFGGYSFW